MRTAFTDGEIKGLKRGLKRGLNKGLKRVVTNSNDAGYPIESISTITGLSIAEIQRILEYNKTKKI